jgi:hypothetical protein
MTDYKRKRDALNLFFCYQTKYSLDGNETQTIPTEPRKKILNHGKWISMLRVYFGTRFAFILSRVREIQSDGSIKTFSCSAAIYFRNKQAIRV